jgi:phosphatidylglycerol---prolipoprotein diacylglyceryl transferase
MHPVLFELPLPRLTLPLGLALGLLALFGLALAALGFGRRERELTLVGLLGGGLAFVFALRLRGARLALDALPVPAFGALLALSLAGGAFLTARFAARAGLAKERTRAACVAACAAGVLGARAAYALLHPRELAEIARVFAFQDGGLVGYGGLVCGIGAAWLALDKRTDQFVAFLDAASPALGFGVLFTRIGCWLEGCDYGRPLGGAAPGWLARLGTFPAGSRAWVEQVVLQRISPAAPAALPVHPTELYEAFGGALLVAVALATRRRQRAHGQAALACLASFALLRVAVDVFREPSVEVWAARVLALLSALLVVVSWPRLIPVSRPA